MPKSPPKPCSHPGCTKLAIKNGRCDDHQPKAWDHKGKTRHERGYDSNWYKIRKRVMERGGYLCQTCKREGVLTKAVQVDHIIPKFKGGLDCFENLEAICLRHHKEKTKKESQEARNGRHN